MAKSYEELSADLDNYIAREQESLSSVRDLLTNVRKQHKILPVFDVEIKITAVIPKRIRHSMETLAKSEGKALEDLEFNVYEVLAGICIEKPWNEIQTWIHIDNEVGIAFDVLKKAYEILIPEENRVRNFR